jgi:protein tyrosine/serine phosphatase
MKTNVLRSSAGVLIAVISLGLSLFGQTSPSHFEGIKIENFGQMDQGYYRGAQPMPDDYQSLKDLGVKTVIDLRNDPTDYEKSSVESLGMKYVNIPMSGWKSPKMSDIDSFLALVNNPETGTIYVHCKAGIHRTGVVGAAYRYTKFGWDYDKAYQEMKNYNFSSGLVHGSLKSFVKDWGQKLHDERAATAAGGAAAAASLSTSKTVN